GVSLGDVDGDGDLDAVFANSDEPNRVYFNQGNCNFIDSEQSLGSNTSHEVSLGDVDGDGDLDAVFANFADDNTVYLNDGNGKFTDTLQSLDLNNSDGVSLGDVDGDGDLDAVFSNYNGDNRVYLNDGNGKFTDAFQSLGSDYSRGVSLGDVDSDGDLDAVFANNGSNSVYLNERRGELQEPTSELQATNPKPNSNDSAVNSDITLTFDRTLNTTTATKENVVLHTSQTSPSNDTVVTASGSNVTINPQADFKPGELVEVTVTDGLASNEGLAAKPYVFQYRTEVATGSAKFRNITTNSFGNFNSIGVSLGDLDSDGYLDAVFANDFGQANQVYLGNGSGNFPDTPQSLGSNNSRGVSLGDVDGDGYLDAVFANRDGANRVYLNDGSGNFPNTTSKSLGSNNSVRS
ncbi:MAG: hypothetical protein F6K54_26465, partial [Okeania sp. SIO3B5]|uniref:FG-GAP-like repeat-containing protein n=1 Tax=Okeania sp. SIO3B5 TaxID=2607811 RepID=UPI0013FF70EA